MRHYHIIIFILVYLFNVPVLFAQEAIAREKSFQQIRSEVRSLWSDQDYDTAIDLLERNRSEFSEGYPEFTVHFYLGLLYLDKENPKKGFQELYAGMDKGYSIRSSQTPFSKFSNTKDRISCWIGKMH
ncbi:MAG: hypothetical protein WD491_10205 [Balneolales bacterium]